MPIACYEKTSITRNLDSDIQFFKMEQPSNLWSGRDSSTSCRSLIWESTAIPIKENIEWKVTLIERVMDFYRGVGVTNISKSYEDAYSIVCRI